MTFLTLHFSLKAAISKADGRIHPQETTSQEAFALRGDAVEHS